MVILSSAPNGIHKKSNSIENAKLNTGTKSFILRGEGDCQIELRVVSELQQIAENLCKLFSSSASTRRRLSISSECELLLLFIEHVTSFISNDGLDECQDMKPFLLYLITVLKSDYFDDQDPHSALPKHLNSMKMSECLRIYLNASLIFSLNKSPTPRLPPILEMARDQQVKSIAVFGGQGNTSRLLEELEDLYLAYYPITSSFLKAIFGALQECAGHKDSVDFLSNGFDLEEWICSPANRPPLEYIHTATISLPIVGIIQLLNYYVLMKYCSLAPRALAEAFCACTGHSQGIVTATVMAISVCEQDFIDNSVKAVKLLFWIGLCSTQAYPSCTLNPKIVKDSLEHGEASPTPMLSIANITLGELQGYLSVANKYLPDCERIHIGLQNGHRSFVCSGPPKSLYGLNLLLRKCKADPSQDDQSKIPFHQRKKNISMRFLMISSPFHSPLLADAVEDVLERVKTENLYFTHQSPSTTIPVISTETGELLKIDGNVTRTLIELICVKPVDWIKTLQPPGGLAFERIFDFGPGHGSGVGAICWQNLKGTGKQIVLCGSFDAPNNPNFLSKRHLFGALDSVTRLPDNWADKYKPRLIRSKVDGRILVETKFSRLVGKQPLMVAGMTPTTSNSPFVVACTNAGYHVELAGGGQFSEMMLRKSVAEIVEGLEDVGQGLSLNCLFINQRQWSFQFPLVQTLRAEGVPFDGFTIAAGVPSLEVANEIIASLQASGIRHVSFKPGSLDGILQVVEIAKSNPDFPIIIQWTGGRSGGHHSYEDIHLPIFESYASIRSCENIVLLIGGGFGDGEGSWPYLDGSWALSFNYPKMPFDGVLVGSRMLVAKEALTSQSVKECIVAAPGVAVEADWVKSYKEQVGGVVTVISEMGEPIHKVATRGVLLWKEFDEKIFSLPKPKRLEYLKNNREYIIARLNADSHKLWFAADEHGNVMDLFEMTFQQILDRLAKLLFLQKEKAWIDPSFQTLFFDFLQRAEERLAPIAGPSCLPSRRDMRKNTIDPIEFLELLKRENLFSLDAVVSAEDSLHFLNLCRRPGQKPVPFIPVLDDSFENWYKKDSLWQSENIHCVPDQDSQRACILQGPVAVKHSRSTEESVKDILDGICKYYVESLLASDYGNCPTNVPSELWFGDQIKIPAPSATWKSNSSIRAKQRIYKTSLSSEDRWPFYAALVGYQKNWLSALLLSPHILQGKVIVSNYVSAVFAPRPHQTFTVECAGEDSAIRSVTIKDNISEDPILSCRIDNKQQIALEVFNGRNSPPLSLIFTFNPQSNVLIGEQMDDRNKRIKEFYWNIWFDGDSTADFRECYEGDPVDAQFTCEQSIQRKDVSKFCNSIRNSLPAYLGKGSLNAPMDYGMVVAWKAIVKCLIPRAIDGDLLKLVHLSNSFHYFDHSTELLCTDYLQTRAAISNIKWTPTGKIVCVEALIFRLPNTEISGNRDAEERVMRIESEFMFRGTFPPQDPSHLYFERREGVSKKVLIKNAKDISILASKDWIKWNDENSVRKIRCMSTIVFTLDYFHVKCYSANVLKQTICKGQIYSIDDAKEFVCIGKVDFEADRRLKKNPILDYISRNQPGVDKPLIFDVPRPLFSESNNALSSSAIVASLSNRTYSELSGDTNPIHTNPLIATLAQLPNTITHGMWTSAATRALVERFAAENQALRVRSYTATFQDMVLPGDKLSPQIHHEGMKNGRKLIKVRLSNQSGVTVMTAAAEVDQPITAFLFTGQGSQQVGMGMDLYESSPIAKSIWEQADGHFCEKYGISILEIVRRNPKTLTVHFGGPKGEEIRSNYMAMDYERTLDDGTTETVSLFPSINESSTSFTFNSPNGLLSATQFTQPALTLMEMAAFEDMRAKGVVGQESFFTGHSLGEYSALAAVGRVLSIETLCDVVFYRGLSMQVAVERNGEGQSRYSMIAVNPSRVHASFNYGDLQALIDKVHAVCERLIEIVNFNVENWQYVVAGDLVALDLLGKCLDHLSKGKVEEGCDGMAPNSSFSQQLAAIPQRIFDKEKEIYSNKDHIQLLRGRASIPLVGIDVPFHSSFLLGGVESFRKCIRSRICLKSIDAKILVDKYIPNLTGSPFNVTLEYFQKVLNVCRSPIIAKVVQDWDESDLSSAPKTQALAHVLLVELLSFQFASPVKWIQCQDFLFGPMGGVERIIEIGPSPVLLGMAKQTLARKYKENDDVLNRERILLAISKDQSEIYYENYEVPIMAKAAESKAELGTDALREKASSAPAPPPPQNTQSSKQYHPSIPLSTAEILQILIATKLKRGSHQIDTQKSIKDLVGGKSTMQNEILADLQKEFGDLLPERAEELSLSDLATCLHPANSADTHALGKHSAALVSKMFSTKMPAGVNESTCKEYLQTKFGFESVASDQLVLTLVPTAPKERFPSEEAVKEWLDGGVVNFFRERNLDLPSSSSTLLPTSPSPISSAELERVERERKGFMARQIELLASYAGISDFDNGHSASDAQQRKIQEELDSILSEHDQTYLEGIKPIFSRKKIRLYNSSWNWAKQDIYLLYHDIIFGKLVNVDRDVASKCLHVMNRASLELVEILDYLLASSRAAAECAAHSEPHQLALQYGQELRDNVKEALNGPPRYKDLSIHTRPQVQTSHTGSIQYHEIRRWGVKSFEDYVSMMTGTAHSGHINGNSHENIIPLLSITCKETKSVDQEKSATYHNVLKSIAKEGITFAGKTFLLSGSGAGSIGSEILKGILSGGGRVVVTSSSFNRKSIDVFRSIYERYGARDSCLVTVPFNQGSTQDLASLIDYVYGGAGAAGTLGGGGGGLGWDLDYLIPFGAIGENGSDICEIGGKSELAHRIMLTNIVRLIGLVVGKKKELRLVTRPTQVILPLSPNHGHFGWDGLYAESKIGLEALSNKWHSEEWSAYASIVGAEIGWTRGTSLMNDNNLISEQIEEQCKIFTFSPNQMAFNIIALMHPKMVRLSQQAPLHANLGGGLDRIKDLHLVTRKIRNTLKGGAEIRRALAEERAAEGSLEVEPVEHAPSLNLRAKLDFKYPPLPTTPSTGEPATFGGCDPISKLIDLETVIVVAGMGEVGPWGNHRTRWEMESKGHFSLEGCIEMAWIMGLISFNKNINSNSNNSKSSSAGQCGWTDAKTGQALADTEIKEKYEAEILRHSGIRLIDPSTSLLSGYDPNKKQLLQELVIDYDMSPIVVSAEDAQHFRAHHGDNVVINPAPNSSQCTVKFRRGATIFVPKALQFSRLVAGQMPRGWNPARYGIPQDIIDQVDPITLYNLVSTVEALVSAGITDPYEFYKYVHVSKVGNACGGGEGGMVANRSLYRERYLDKPAQMDIFQESFINTMPAWVNLLLLSASGPIKTPVGACATAVESVEIGCDTLLSGKAKIVLVGGYDDFQEESSQEFANMGATSNSLEESAKGRLPHEQSRPNTNSRAGFMESQGAGTQILMSAALALEMGCPIYGIIAMTGTAMDRQGKSVPAPGQGILTSAQCIPLAKDKHQKMKLMDPQYRQRQLYRELDNLSTALKDRIDAAHSDSPPVDDDSTFIAFDSKENILKTANAPKSTDNNSWELEQIRQEFAKRQKSIQQWWGHFFWHDNPHLSPIEGALAVWGLGIDDLGVASLHSTGTPANDTNEASVTHQQMQHLGRARGNPLAVIAQKYLTGHPKGAAAAWMLNGLMQSMLSGMIPGNRNADNIDEELRQYTHLFYPSQCIGSTGGIKAGLLKSFGFGQVGGEVLVVHPNQLLSRLEPQLLKAYAEKRAKRERATCRYIQETLIDSRPFVQVKEDAPYSTIIQSQVLLNPLARTQFSPKTSSYQISPKDLESALAKHGSAFSASAPIGIGCDLQICSELSMDDHFLTRNFTKRELDYARTHAAPRDCLAGKWAAKEATVKALCSHHRTQATDGSKPPEWLQGAAAPLLALEIVNDESGLPHVRFRNAAFDLGVSEDMIKISISHSGSYAIAIATIGQK